MDVVAPPRLRERAWAVAASSAPRFDWRTRPPISWRSPSIFGAARFAAAAVVVALFGGFLLVAQPSDRVAVTVPGAETEGLPPVTGPAGNGLIAYSRDGDIYVGDPLTGESEVVVAGPAYDAEPAFSPDGSRIAFLRCKEGYRLDGLGGLCSTLMSVRPDGSDEGLIGPAPHYLWTPDGQSLIVYERDEPTGTLTLLDASGDAPPRTLTLPTLDLYWGGPPFAGYSGVATFMRPPLGDRILAWTIEDKPGYLDVMDADGSNVTRLIDETWLTDHGYSGVYAPSWSPDGSRIAFSTWSDEEGQRTVVMDAEGLVLRVLAGGGDWSGDWSPDGTRILLRDPCDGEGCEDSLITTSIATGLSRQVAHAPYLHDSWWSPDGMSILYTAGEPQDRAFTVDVVSGEVTELPWEFDGFPNWRLSWQRIAAD